MFHSFIFFQQILTEHLLCIKRWGRWAYIPLRETGDHQMLCSECLCLQKIHIFKSYCLVHGIRRWGFRGELVPHHLSPVVLQWPPNPSPCFRPRHPSVPLNRVTKMKVSRWVTAVLLDALPTQIKS